MHSQMHPSRTRVPKVSQALGASFQKAWVAATTIVERRCTWDRSRAALGQSDHTRRGLDGQPGDERDGAERCDEKSGARRDVEVLDGHLEARGRAERLGVVRERVLRLGHADGQRAQCGVALVLRDARLGLGRVLGARATVHLLDDRGGARGHYGASEHRRAGAALRKVVGGHRVKGAALLGQLGHQLDLPVRVGVEAVDRDDHLDAVRAHVADVREHVGRALLHQVQRLLRVLLGKRRAGYHVGRLARVQLERAHRGHKHGALWS
eukprot:6180226-Pleurochrysis_carterae.AAC.3